MSRSERKIIEEYCDIIDIEIVEESESHVPVSQSPAVPTQCWQRPRRKSTYDKKAGILEVLEASSF